MSEGSDSDRYDDPIDENDNALDYLRDSEWPLTTLASLVDEFQDPSEPNTQDLVLCDAELVGALKALKLDPDVVQPKLSVGREWRRLYTDAVVLRCLNILIENSEQRAGDPSSPKETQKDSSKADSTTWEQAIRLLDQAIVLAGAPGERRLELVLSCISYIQYWHLAYQVSESSPFDALERPTGPVLATSPVPAIDPAPPVSAFSQLAQRPFVLPGFAATWPAISCWTSREYLRSSGGRGRIVPIERGGDYRTDDWSVDLMPWDEFLESIKWGETQESDDEHKVYLAQHSLFTQFPKLRADIEVPDYVYTEPGTCTFASSHYGGPPGNEEQLVINAWCGGRGANSPAHTDPYHNIYVQAVGYKLVWLAPPEATPGMYAFNSASPDGENKPKADRDPKREGMLGNTSSLDVFSLSQAEGNENSSHPAFKEHALPHAQSIMLGPGDALVIPPGWWHAMRGIGGGSFSVSFWF